MHDQHDLKPEDYMERACVLIDPSTGQKYTSSRLPVQRIVEKLEEYCARKDFAGAERHLQYWLEEARFNRDGEGEFTMRNEMMGFYRKQGRQEEAVQNAHEALDLMERLGLSDTVSGGTCLVNCGTVYDNFGMPEEALSYFQRARDVYEAAAYCSSDKLGGLYNNMGLALMDTGQFSEAGACFLKALELMSRAEGGELEQAITYMNMADAAAMEQGIEQADALIADYMERAKELLDSETLPRDGYYAYVCERCAPGFYCYGYDQYGAEIDARAKEIFG